MTETECSLARDQEDRDAPQGRDQAAGFTLLELLVVITILGMLAAVVATVALDQLGGAKTDTAKLQIDQINTGIDLFRLDVGRFPSEQEGLRALVEAPDGAERWRGPYLKKAEVLNDPWGRPFIYTYPGQHGEADIYSLGADNAEGGEGEDSDVTSW